jgi:hypothetical protein
MLDLNNKSVIIAGTFGTGKTYLAKFISRRYKTVVYSPYKEEWANENAVFIETPYYENDLNFWCGEMIKMAKSNKINCAVFDDADLLFRTQFDIAFNFKELFVKHRHIGKNGIALIFVTRRPQDIPTKIYSSCEFWALFGTNSPQAHRLFDEMHENLGEMVKGLTIESHNFYLIEVGKEPRMMRV